MAKLRLIGDGRIGRPLELDYRSGGSDRAWVRYYLLADGGIDGFAETLPEAALDFVVEDLIASSGASAVLPEAILDFVVEDLDALGGDTSIELPVATLGLIATDLLVDNDASPAYFANVAPAPDATGYRGPDRITFDVLTSDIGQPVDEDSIEVEVDGVAVAISSAIPIVSGFRVTAPYRFNAEEIYEITLRAATSTTLGDPAELVYEISTALWIASPLAVTGLVADVLPAPVGLAGTVLRIGDCFLSLRGNILQVPPSPVALSGSVSFALDLLRSGEAVILDGYVTVYVSELLLCMSIGVGDPASDVVEMTIEAEDPGAGYPALEATIEAYSVGGLAALEATIGVYLESSETFEMAIGTGAGTGEAFEASVDVDGYAASGMVVVESPSAEWTSDEEDETE